MLSSEYKREMESFVPNAAQLARLRERLDHAPERPRLYLGRKAVVAIAICAALLISALAVAPTLWDIIMGDLGAKAPYATEVLASCEDQGIRIEAVAALADSRVTRLYFTMQDLTEDRLKEDTEWDLMLSLSADGSFGWGNGGKGEEVLSYDPERKLATMVFSRGTGELSSAIPTQARLIMKHLTPGDRSAQLTLDGDEVPAPTLESTVTQDGRTVLLPDQNPRALETRIGAPTPGQQIQTEPVAEVSISSMGFAADGMYHIRFWQNPDITPVYGSEYAGQPLFDVGYYMRDPQQPDRWHSQSMPDVDYVQVEDGWDFRLPSLTPDTLCYLQILSPDAHYSVAGGRIEGNWELIVPVEAVDQRLCVPKDDLILPYVFRGEMPFKRFFDAQVDNVVVSPLSVVVNCITPEGQENPCQLTGMETLLTVTLSDGTILTPAYYSDVWSQRVGWIMWEFSEPIDLSTVVSVTLEGHTIPLQQ